MFDEHQKEFRERAREMERGFLRRAGLAAVIYGSFAVLMVLLVICGIILIVREAKADPIQGQTILVVIADDADHTIVGGKYPTAMPTVAKLRRLGTTYQRAWVPNKCAPSLASILTGKHPRDHGRWANTMSGGGGDVDMSESFPVILQQNGWRNYRGGKHWWPMEGSGFEVKHPGHHSEFVRNGQDHLFQWIEALATTDDAMIWWAPMLPHTPHNAPTEHLIATDFRSIQIPPEVPEENRQACRQAEWQFVGMHRWFDAELRSLGLKLKEVGRDENLSVIFLMDNGYAMGRYSKNSPYEHGIRTPITIVGDGFEAGRERWELARGLDVHATTLQIAGLAQNQSLPSRDLSGVGPQRQAMVLGSWPSRVHTSEWSDVLLAASATDGDYTLIRWYGDIVQGGNNDIKLRHECLPLPLRTSGDEELYHTAADPHQRCPIVDPQRSAALGLLINQWITE